MNYAYYNQAPAWGTQSYHPGKPPTPAYQPQPSWGGGDYYRAHTGSNDEYVSMSSAVLTPILRATSSLTVPLSPMHGVERVTEELEAQVNQRRDTGIKKSMVVR